MWWSDAVERKLMDRLRDVANEFGCTMPGLIRHVSKIRMDETRRIHVAAYNPWSEMEESLLCSLVHKGMSVKDIAHRMRRSVGGICSRKTKLGLSP